MLAGTIEPADRAIYIVYEEGGQMLLAGTSDQNLYINTEVANEGDRGNLFIVEPDGDYRSEGLSYFDPSGIRIAAPLGKNDKVAYVDKEGNVLGGLGLAWFEIKQIIEVNRLDDSVLDILQGPALDDLMKTIAQLDDKKTLDESLTGHDIYQQIADMKIKVDAFDFMNDYKKDDSQEGDVPSKLIKGAQVEDLFVDISLPEDLKVVTSGSVFMME